MIMFCLDICIKKKDYGLKERWALGGGCDSFMLYMRKINWCQEEKKQSGKSR